MKRYKTQIKKIGAITFALAFSMIITAPWAVAGSVVDRCSDGIDVGLIFQPDTITFDPATLDTLTCFAPTGERPLYEIAIPLGDWEGGSGAKISKVVINGVECIAYGIYTDGLAHLQEGHSWITRSSETAKNVVVLAKALWHNDERIIAKVVVEHADNGKTFTIAGRAPSTGGMPSGSVHYESFGLTEEAGINREGEPVEISLSVYPEEVATPDEKGGLASEVRLYRVPEKGDPIAVPFQVYDSGGVPGVPNAPDNQSYLYRESKTVRIVFAAEVSAHKTVPYVLTYGCDYLPPPPAPKKRLHIEGEAPGFIVSNEYYTCKLEPNSGQIVSIKMNGEENEDVPPFTNSLTRAMHWNPDSYGSNGKWGHTFAWDPPDKTVVAADGPIMLRITNSGRMPDETPHVYASVSYTFYADTPYIGVSTVMEVRDRYSSSAMRNGEVVVDSHLVTHFVWKDNAGQINRVNTKVTPGQRDEMAVMAEYNIPWIAVTNELDRYGMAAIWTTVDAYQRDMGTKPIHRPGYFCYNHHAWGTPLTYFTRAWVYPFAYKERRPNIYIEPGAVYFERGAFYPFRIAKKNDYGSVEKMDTLLRQPLIRKTGN